MNYILSGAIEVSKRTKNKVNPRNIPKTQKDVSDAFGNGWKVGVKDAEVLFMNIMLDKHEHEIDIVGLWNDMLKYEHELAEGRIKMADVRQILKEDYGCEFDPAYEQFCV